MYSNNYCRVRRHTKSRAAPLSLSVRSLGGERKNLCATGRRGRHHFYSSRKIKPVSIASSDNHEYFIRIIFPAPIGALFSLRPRTYVDPPSAVWRDGGGNNVRRIQDPDCGPCRWPCINGVSTAQIMDLPRPAPVFAAFTRGRKGRHDLADRANRALVRIAARINRLHGSPRNGPSQDTVMTRVTGNVACRK